MNSIEITNKVVPKKIKLKTSEVLNPFIFLIFVKKSQTVTKLKSTVVIRSKFIGLS